MVKKRNSDFEEASKMEKVLEKFIFKMAKVMGFNQTVRGTIVSIDSTYRATVKILDDTTNRTGVVIPEQVAGTLAVSDDVMITITNGDSTNMTIWHKVQ